MSRRFSMLVLCASIGVALALPFDARADALCTTSTQFFNSTLNAVGQQDIFVLGPGGGTPGVECVVINFSNLALVGGPFQIELVDSPTQVSDVITLANNLHGQLQVCVESAPFTGGNPTIDCPTVASTQFEKEGSSNFIGVFSTLGGVPGVKVTLSSNDSDVATFTGAPEPSSLTLFSTALLGVGVLFAVRKQLG
jgi:hypothetical protein